MAGGNVTAAVIVLACTLAAAVVGLVLLARSLPALVERLRVNGDALVDERTKRLETERLRDTAVARETYQRARADDAIAQLDKTQVAYNAAALLVAKERQLRIQHMSVEELVEGVNAEISKLSNAPGTALEVPE